MAQQLSPIAKPDDIRLTDNLPKTRSGKIMRRLLRAIARGEEITQDVSTLENPAILEQLRGEPGAGSVPVGSKVKRVSKGKVRSKGKAKAKTVKAKPAKAKARAAKPKTKGVRTPAASRGKAKAAARSKVKPKAVIRTKKSGRKARGKK